jgi:hypothetical protein
VTRLYVATGDGIARLDEVGAAWTVDLSLPGSGVHCLAVDPADPTLELRGGVLEALVALGDATH